MPAFPDPRGVDLYDLSVRFEHYRTAVMQMPNLADQPDLWRDRWTRLRAEADELEAESAERISAG